LIAKGSIFISHASEQGNLADGLAQKLRGRGFVVFLDRDSLPAGESYDDRILKAIRRCHVFVFLITPDAVRSGKYALTELGYAKKRWKNPTRAVLPVMLEQTPLDSIDPYLRQSVSILRFKGNFETEVANAVEDLRSAQVKPLRMAIVAAAMVAVLGAGLRQWLREPQAVQEQLTGSAGMAGHAALGGTGTGSSEVGGASAGGTTTIQAGEGGALGDAGKPSKIVTTKPNPRRICKEHLSPPPESLLICECNGARIKDSGEKVVSIDAFKQMRGWKCE